MEQSVLWSRFESMLNIKMWSIKNGAILIFRKNM